MNEAISEFDRELLESYLDDGLSAAQVEHVAARLAEEPALAEAMHGLRVERVMRLAAWRSAEPDESSADCLADRVSAAVRRHDRRQAMTRTVKIASAAAACVALFAGVLVLRDRTAGPTPVKLAGLGASQPAGPRPTAGPFHVALVDDAGRVIAVQKFNHPADARQFADDLIRYESRRREMRDGGTMLISDQF